MTDPTPGRLYRFKGDGKFFVPIHQVGVLAGGEVLWRCLTQEGVATLCLWSGSYDLVEEA